MLMLIYDYSIRRRMSRLGELTDSQGLLLMTTCALALSPCPSCLSSPALLRLQGSSVCRALSVNNYTVHITSPNEAVATARAPHWHETY